MVTRRGFLAGILAAAVAPAIVRADALMRIVPRETKIIPYYFDSTTGTLYKGELGGWRGVTIQKPTRREMQRMAEQIAALPKPLTIDVKGDECYVILPGRGTLEAFQ